MVVQQARVGMVSSNEFVFGKLRREGSNISALISFRKMYLRLISKEFSLNRRNCGSSNIFDVSICVYVLIS